MLADDRAEESPVGDARILISTSVCDQADCRGRWVLLVNFDETGEDLDNLLGSPVRERLRDSSPGL